MENRFNLIDEPWIPVTDHGLVSLRQIFSEPSYRALSGNSVQKVAVMKLLLAIAQSACTPLDEHEWSALSPDQLSARCLEHLISWHGRFFLFGESPFLQVPAIASAELKSYGTVMPEVATGNTTILNHSQIEHPLSDAEKALLLVCLMSFALGGKKTDNSIVLSPGYAGKANDKGKPSTGKPGPAVAHIGLLHTLLQGQTIWQSLKLNLLTLDQIRSSQQFPNGIGIPPWVKMPSGEACEVALALRASLMGRLVPLCRFCLLAEHGLHYSEGIAHANYKEGVCDPTAAVNFAGKEPKALWANPEKRPWRELTSLLSFFSRESGSGYSCLQLNPGTARARTFVDSFAIWSGGLKVSSNAGEQYTTGTDDFVESQVWLHSESLGELWFAQLQSELTELDAMAKDLYGRVLAYCKTLSMERNVCPAIAAQATHMFWQLCERDFQALVDSCDGGGSPSETRDLVRRNFANNATSCFDTYCPNTSARQLDAWAKSRPNHFKYLHKDA